MKKQRQKLIKTVAIHEAGHAVVRYLTGFKPVLITIIPDGKTAGLCSAYESSLAGVPDLPPELRESMAVNNVAGLAAGVAAEVKYRPWEPRGFFALAGGSSDYKKMREFATDQCNGDEEKIKRLIDQGEAKAKKILEDHFDKVIALATELEKRKTVKGDQIIDAMFDGAYLPTDEKVSRAKIGNGQRPIER